VIKFHPYKLLFMDLERVKWRQRTRFIGPTTILCGHLLRREKLRRTQHKSINN